MAPFPSPTKTWHDNTYPALSPDRPELSAKGKSVLITGGGTGIGAETGRYFAKAGAARIALLGRREQPLLDTKAVIEKESPKTVVFTASVDVTNKTQVDEAFQKFAAKEPIDVLVSNAAVTGPMDSVVDAPADKFLSSIETNIKGNTYVAQAFARHHTKDAVVIDVNSAGAHFSFSSGIAAYSISKMAVFRLWDCFALARPELSVFHIQPGVVNTAMNKEAGGVEAVGWEDHVSLPASFNVWLASPEAKFLKGRFLYSNWDVEELKAQAAEIESSEQFKIGLVGWPFSDSNWKFEPTAKAGAGWT